MVVLGSDLLDFKLWWVLGVASDLTLRSVRDLLDNIQQRHQDFHLANVANVAHLISEHEGSILSADVGHVESQIL